MRTTFFLLLFHLFVKAQIDTAISVPLVGIHVGGQLPGADMAKRFGANLQIGGSFIFKHKSNWIYGLEGGYMFGRNIREDVLQNMKTPEGYVIDNEGFPADLRVTQRGFGIYLTGGKVLKFLSSNHNSGLLLMAGAGYLQHKINLYDAQQKVAAVRGDLKYGYDRLSGGISFNQFIGYLFLSENRMTNFYFGFSFSQSLTKSFRGLNYDTGLIDNSQRLDLLHGFRFGWVLPLYKRKPNEFYYY